MDACHGQREAHEESRNAVTADSRPTKLNDMSAILEKMREVLAKHFGIDDSSITMESTLESLGLDSLAFIEYTFELEKVLHIVLPDLPRDMVTVGDLAQVVDSEVRRQTQGAVA